MAQGKEAEGGVGIDAGSVTDRWSRRAGLTAGRPSTCPCPRVYPLSGLCAHMFSFKPDASPENSSLRTYVCASQVGGENTAWEIDDRRHGGTRWWTVRGDVPVAKFVFFTPVGTVAPSPSASHTSGRACMYTPVDMAWVEDT